MGDPEGLAVPVLRDADQMSFARIEQAIGDFVQRTKDRALTLEGSTGRHLHHHQWGLLGSFGGIGPPPAPALLGREEELIVGGLQP